jgi:hypothetical protein
MVGTPYAKGLRAVGTRAAPKNYSDIGLGPDPANFNNSIIMNAQNPEVPSYGGFYGYAGVSMAGLLWDSILKATIDLGSFIRTLLGIQNVAGSSAAYSLTVLLQWGILLNHAFVIFQLVFRPMGYEL